MHVSIRRYEGVQSISHVCRKIGEGFVPILKRTPGFISYYAIDCGDGVLATVSVFSTEAMAIESNETAAAWLKENVADLQPNPPQISAGLVRIAATA